MVARSPAIEPVLCSCFNSTSEINYVGYVQLRISLHTGAHTGISTVLVRLMLLVELENVITFRSTINQVAGAQYWHERSSAHNKL